MYVNSSQATQQCVVSRRLITEKNSTHSVHNVLPPPLPLPLPAYTFGAIYAGLNEDWMSIIAYKLLATCTYVNEV